MTFSTLEVNINNKTKKKTLIVSSNSFHAQEIIKIDQKCWFKNTLCFVIVLILVEIFNHKMEKVGRLTCFIRILYCVKQKKYFFLQFSEFAFGAYNQC